MHEIHLPKLNNLRPTLLSTLFKAVEEAGELARAVLKFLPYEYKKEDTIEISGKLLKNVCEELLDVAQVCVTMIFVMEDDYNINISQLIDDHLLKLKKKGYRFDEKQNYCVVTTGNFKSLHLPRLEMEGITLLTTVCKIEEELGELTQFLGKCSGASGEQRRLTDNEIMHNCALELLDIAQCCFTMTYILEENYNVDIAKLVKTHIEKLRIRGYWAS